MPSFNTCLYTEVMSKGPNDEGLIFETSEVVLGWSRMGGRWWQYTIVELITWTYLDIIQGYRAPMQGW